MVANANTNESTDTQLNTEDYDSPFEFADQEYFGEIRFNRLAFMFALMTYTLIIENEAYTASVGVFDTFGGVVTPTVYSVGLLVSACALVYMCIPDMINTFRAFGRMFYDFGSIVKNKVVN